VLHKLKGRKVRVVVNTRDPLEHDVERQRSAAHQAVAPLVMETKDTFQTSYGTYELE